MSREHKSKQPFSTIKLNFTLIRLKKTLSTCSLMVQSRWPTKNLLQSATISQSSLEKIVPSKIAQTIKEFEAKVFLLSKLAILRGMKR